MKPERPPYCLICKHLRIVPGHKQPHICALWQIRTGPNRYPSNAIFQTLKRHCQYHEKKPDKTPPPRTSADGEGSGLDIKI